MKDIKKDKSLSMNKGQKNEIIGYVCIAPVVLGILIFTLYPMLSSLYYSMFEKYTVISKPQNFNPIYNIKKMWEDEWLWILRKQVTDLGGGRVQVKWIVGALGNTLLYSLISVPFNIILSFITALLLNTKLKGIAVFRVLCYLPVVIPVTVSGLIWKGVFNVEYGIANKLLLDLGLKPMQFFSGRWSAMPTLIFTGIWSVGSSMVLWLAALKNVPVSLYESAKLDGAGTFVKLFKITIPMCTPTILYNLIMSIIGAMQVFGGVVAITGGSTGPDNALLFYVMKVYNEAFGGALKMSYACSLSWLLFIIIAGFSLLLFKTSKWVVYEE